MGINPVAAVAMMADDPARTLVIRELLRRECERLRMDEIETEGAETPEEAVIMRTHAELGARLLGNSQKPVLRLAAEIASSHHENWDGSGYPLGLTGTDIPIGGRITMVADVFDALGSRRCYKDSWSPESIRQFMLDQRERKFDPEVVDCLFECWDHAMELREKLPD